MNEINLEQQRKGRLVFIAMALFFIVPIIIVWAMFKFNWKPSGQSFGELIQPPRLIANTESLQFSDQQSAKNFWNEKWNLVILAEQCEQNCLSRLHDMRQIKVSMYKDMPRVERILITPAQDVSEIKRLYPDMLIINQPKSVVSQLTEQFKIGNTNPLSQGDLYFVDPLGHIMMRYDIKTKRELIRKDLARLLKSSWAG